MSTQAATSPGPIGGAADLAAPPRSRRMPLRNAPYLLFPLVLFLVVPAQVLRENERDLATFHPVGFLLLATTAAVVSAFLLGLGHLESRLTDRRFFSLLIEFALFFVVVTGLVLPVSANGQIGDPQSAPIHVGHLLAAMAAAFGMLLVAASKMRGSLYTALGAFVGVYALLAAPALYSLVVSPVAGSAAAGASIYSVSSARNVIVLSFDGVPGSAVLEILEHDDDLRERFAGFTLFTGVASSSTATGPSTATSLLGNRDYKKTYQTEEEIWDSAPERLITNQLNRNGWRVSTYGEYTHEFNETSRAFVELVPRPPPSAFTLIQYGLARTLTRVLVISGWLEDRLEAMYTEALAAMTGASYDPASRLAASHLPEWRLPFTATVLDFDEYLEHLHVERDEPVAHFLHFTHTHYPVEFDRECRWAALDQAWYAAHQNRAGVVGQTRCALAQLAAYVEKLRMLDVFDESLIILKSDHGEPAFYYDSDSLESFPIRAHPYWGYGRYAPFLLIKRFGPAGADLSLDGHPVLLDDLARTLCVQAAIEADCQGYGGYDLLGDDWSGIEDDEITMFIVAGPGSTHRYDTHEPITLRRGSRILATLHERLSAGLLQSSVRCAGSIDTAGGEQLDNGRSDHRSWLTWHDRGSSFLRFRLEQPCTAIEVLIGDVGDRIAQGDVSVLANGQSVEAGFRFAGVRESSAAILSFDIPLPTSDEPHDLVIEVRRLDDKRAGSWPIVGVRFRVSQS